MTIEMQPGDAAELHFDPPEAQRRLTVAFRWILLIPSLICGVAFAIAAYFVLILGWFGALALGRLPGWVARYLSGVLHFYARLLGYQLLLTDVYPPFSLGDQPYPIRLAVEPGRLNRFAVFFRAILAIPAAIVAQLLSTGVVIVSVVAWIITLIRGSMPESIHFAFAACVRYQIRFYCWYAMLSSTYPRDLFGDVGAMTYSGTPPSPGAYVANSYPTMPVPQSYPLGSTPKPTVEDIWGSPYPQPATAPDPPGLPRFPEAVQHEQSSPWRLVLSKASRRIVVVVIVLGLAGSSVGNVVRFHGFRNQIAIVEIKAAYSTLVDQTRTFGAEADTCQGSLSCRQKYEVTYYQEMSAFAQSISGISLPSADRSDKHELVATADDLVSELTTLSTEPNSAAYDSSPALGAVKANLAVLDSQYLALVAAI